MPKGGVIAAQELIAPSAVGYDIACGNLAARLDIPAEQVRANIKTIMDDVARQLSFGIGRAARWKVDDPLFEDPLWDEIPALRTIFAKRRAAKTASMKTLKDVAREQLGAVGSGNHYVDIFVDENDDVWVGVHFGSRGFGHNVASHYLDAAGATDGNQDALPMHLHTLRPIGVVMAGDDVTDPYKDWENGPPSRRHAGAGRRVSHGSPLLSLRYAVRRSRRMY